MYTFLFPWRVLIKLYSKSKISFHQILASAISCLKVTKIPVFWDITFDVWHHIVLSVLMKCPAQFFLVNLIHINSNAIYLSSHHQANLLKYKMA